MYLTKWEEKAVQGEFGEALQISMDILTQVCKSLKAKKLVKIGHAHVSGVSYFNIGDEGLELLEDLVKKGAKVSVYTTANPSSIALTNIFNSMYSREVVIKQMKIVDLLISMGIDKGSFTCTPYKLRMPGYGEHLAWAESSAVIYANSIRGARTNREGGILALIAAITGRTCFYGMHIDELRRPTELIEVRGPIDSIAVASALGLYIGKITHGIPYIKINNVELKGKLKDIAIRSMLSSIASTSNSALAFIEGISPEAKKVYAEPSEKIIVDLHDVRKFIVNECSDSILIGCPHVDVEEAQEVIANVASKLRELKINRVYITMPLYLNSERFRDLTKKIDGVEIVYLPGVCLVVSDLKTIGIKAISTIHGKAFHYIPRLAGVSACLTNIV